METALLLLGVCFFLVCTLLFLRFAFQSTVGWGLMGILLPPSAILFYSLSWKRLRPLALMHLASLCLLVFALALWVRAHPYGFDGTPMAGLRDWLAPAYGRYPLKIEPASFVSESALQPYLKQGRRHAGGVVDGTRVDFVRATLVNGILRFKSDEDLFSATEISIPLAAVELKPGENLLEYTPASVQVPAVYVTHYPVDETEPRVEVFDHDYWMDLMVSVNDNDVYTGYIKLRLPDRDRSFVAGAFRAFTRDLRYVDDDVDRTFDSNATIEYVAQNYIANKLGNALESVEGFDDTFFQTTLENPTARTEASIRMLDGSEHQVKMSLIKGSDGWVVQSGPSAELISALRTLTTQPAASIKPMPSVETARVIDPMAVDTLVGRDVVIKTHDGRQREGRVSDVNAYSITLATPLDGGLMSMLVKRRDIVEVKLQQ